MRFLPHYQEDGKTLRNMHWVRYLMMFPEQEQEATRISQIVDDETVAIKDGQDGFSNIAQSMGKIIRTRETLGRLSGMVFELMLHNCARGDEPHYTRSIEAVSNVMSRMKDTAGKNIPSDNRRLRKELPTFRSALHLWATYQLLEAEEMENAFRDTDAFLKLLFGAEAMRVRALELDLPNRAEVLKDWNPWCADRGFLFEMSGGADFELSFPPEDERFQAEFRNYRRRKR